MAGFIPRLGVLLISTVIASCISPQAAVDSLAIRKLDSIPAKVFILSYESQGLPDSFHEGYAKTIAAEFNKLGCVTDIIGITGLELDRNAHIKKMQAFEPDLTMILRFQSSNTTDSIHYGTINMSLVEYRENQQAWKSYQGFRFDHVTNSMTFDAGAKFAGEAFQSLLKDGVFPSHESTKTDQTQGY
jgi:hypothetical protein